MEENKHAKAYWHANLKLVFVLLSIWAFVSYICAILCRDWMDANMPQIGHAKFGFWMAQQGSIICFVFLLIAYAFFMNRLDEKFGYQESDDEEEDDYLSHHPNVEAEIEAHQAEANAEGK